MAGKQPELFEKGFRDTSTGVDPFEEFWSFAQRKRSKRDVKKKWTEIVTEISADRGITLQEARKWLLSRWKQYNETEAARTKNHWYPHTWLNQGHYDTDPGEIEKAAKFLKEKEPVKRHVPSREEIRKKLIYRIEIDTAKEVRAKMRGEPIDDICAAVDKEIARRIGELK